MSWLFDRLCEIAVADQVDVVIAASVGEGPDRGGEADFVDVLARAAAVPQLTVTVLPSDAPPLASLGACLRTVDLDDLDADLAPGDPIDAIAALVSQQQTGARGLRVRGNVVSLHSATGRPVAVVDDDRRTVFATDAPGRGDDLRAAGRRGLGIAVGGVDPDAHVRVDTFLGVVSIIDALVTLRSFAFGSGATRASIPSRDRSATVSHPPAAMPPRVLRSVG